jgi:hypothetical protein
MFCMPAHLADKEVPGPSICPFGVQTPVALLAGLLRVHKDHGHPGSLCFVGDERPELSERPTVQSVTLIPFSPCPFANAVEFFEGDTPFGALSQRYDAFRNYVIGISSEPPLFFAPSPQKAFGALGALFLELAAKCVMAVPNLIELLSAVTVAVGIKGDVSYSQIDADQVHDAFLFFIGQVNCDVQEELAIAADQAALFHEGKRAAGAVFLRRQTG